MSRDNFRLSRKLFLFMKYYLTHLQQIRDQNSNDLIEEIRKLRIKETEQNFKIEQKYMHAPITVGTLYVDAFSSSKEHAWDGRIGISILHSLDPKEKPIEDKEIILQNLDRVCLSTWNPDTFEGYHNLELLFEPEINLNEIINFKHHKYPSGMRLAQMSLYGTIIAHEKGPYFFCPANTETSMKLNRGTDVINTPLYSVRMIWEDGIRIQKSEIEHRNKDPEKISLGRIDYLLKHLEIEMKGDVTY